MKKSHDRPPSTDDRRQTWDAFREAGLLWWVNRSLHLFGWGIVVKTNADDKVIDVCPEKVSFRGFPQENEDRGFRRMAATFGLPKGEEAPARLPAPVVGGLYRLHLNGVVGVYRVERVTDDTVFVEDVCVQTATVINVWRVDWKWACLGGPIN